MKRYDDLDKEKIDLNNILDNKNEIGNKGYVLNIQHYSLHDGPGIRTVVFLKGCPLRCRWCSNPESQLSTPEISYKKKKCIYCFECSEVCDKKAINRELDSKTFINRDICNNCGKCTKVCPAKALTVYGQLMDYKSVVDVVEKDSDFYLKSQGGLTISGGEPLLQVEFTKSILKEAKSRHIHRVIETCGYAKWEHFREVAKLIDYIIFDIKSMNEYKHKEQTGVSNKLILDNFIKLCEEFNDLPKLVRTPIIPGFNDSIKDIESIKEFLKDKPNVKYELLPYHRLGKVKYENLDREYLMKYLKLDNNIMKYLENEND